MTDVGEFYDQRFQGMSRLYGKVGAERVRGAHVAIVGLGGVGSWAVESLGRCGIGRLTLIDLDEICVNNINRQLHALESTVGRQKGEVLADRVKSFHPLCNVSVIQDFLTSDNVAELITPEFDVVIDAIDSVQNKGHLIAYCLKLPVPVIASGGAGGRKDPSRLKLGRLNSSHDDALLRSVRRCLRKQHHLGNPEQARVRAVYSDEAVQFPWDQDVLVEPRGRLDCASGYGTVVHMTASMGFLLAHAAIEILTQPQERDQQCGSSIESKRTSTLGNPVEDSLTR